MDRNRIAKAYEIVALLGIGLTIIVQLVVSGRDPSGNLYHTLGMIQLGFWTLAVTAGFLPTCPRLAEQDQFQAE